MSMLFKRIKDWATSITAFRTGDVIPVDGPSGTAKMSKDALLQKTAENALGSIKTLSEAATEEDLVPQNYLALDTLSGPKKFPAEKLDASCRCLIITDNPEYVFAIVDVNGKFLFGIKKDGSIDWSKGVPEPINAEKVDKVDGYSLIDSIFAESSYHIDNDEYISVLMDSKNKLLEAVNASGEKQFFTKIIPSGGIVWTKENLEALATSFRDGGFSFGTGDWSDKDYIQIDKPKCAIINFSGIEAMPVTKTQDLVAVMQFWDMDGNYFKKNVVINAQGTSSLTMPKKNVSIDLGFKLKIGNWVEQDSYHLKAYYTDYFRGIPSVCYDLYKEILDTRSPDCNRTWKMGLIDFESKTAGLGLGYGGEEKDKLNKDEGPLCFPQGFPCIVCLNGEFYGIFAFNLKKHRSNYNMDKNAKKQIHLDGTINANTFFGGTIDWTQFEVRNPKISVDIDGNDYDGDNPTEIPDGETKTCIQNFANAMPSIASAYNTWLNDQTQENLDAARLAYESVFNKENSIDYTIFSDVVKNTDGFSKNWQWTTWDGIHWFVNAYDLDMVFGASWDGSGISSPRVLTYAPDIPISAYARNLYKDEIEARYKELRDLGIISTKNIINKVSSLVQSIGGENYKNEWSKWPETPCNNDFVINSDYWELADNEPIGNSETYSDSTSYLIGDFVYHGLNENMGYYKFICKAPCTGKPPILKFNFHDSIWRLQKWIELQIALVDNLYNYNNEEA